MHFCHEELFAIMAAIPAVGFVFTWIKIKLFPKKHKCACPNQPKGD